VTVDPDHGYGQDDDGNDLPPPDPLVALIERVMRAHLPIQFEDGKVMCLHNPDESPLIFYGPVYHRWHVAELIVAELAR